MQMHASNVNYRRKKQLLGLTFLRIGMKTVYRSRSGSFAFSLFYSAERCRELISGSHGTFTNSRSGSLCNTPLRVKDSVR